MTSLPATTIELTQVEAASRIQQAYRHYLVKKQQNKNLDFVKSLVKGSSIGVHRTLDKASWLEANDPKHRYGQHLAPYHAAWIATGSNENFYTWLDEGEGKEVSTEKCPRAALDEGQVEYCNEAAREQYHVSYNQSEGKWRYTVGEKLVHTQEEKDFYDTGGHDRMYIFVLDMENRIYTHAKIKAKFQHSSFLAGGPVRCSGLIWFNEGSLKAMMPYSGHYRPDSQDMDAFTQALAQMGLNDLSGIEFLKPVKWDLRIKQEWRW